ncbi:hypothetical protein JTB14_010948 [Gonioctena quinquepunctata]|nr:hypothetical protein JTB14_010948 [Gonioctena quinquepunctata]
MVEEDRLARNVSENILFDSAMGLFVHETYQFYKDCRTRVGSWSELVAEFRDEYLLANHMDNPFEELQRRTPSESYFNRLQCPMSEIAKMAIVMKNLHPLYQDRLEDPPPSNLSELREVSRIMESYVEHSSLRAIIEKNLAFMEVTEGLNALEIATNQPLLVGPQQVVCFRCHKPGHCAIGCVFPKQPKCFGCNREGYTRRNCPMKGNGHGHS